jgi:hypothetical protein
MSRNRLSYGRGSVTHRTPFRLRSSELPRFFKGLRKPCRPAICIVGEESASLRARLRSESGDKGVAGVGALTCSNGVHAVALAKASCGRGSVLWGEYVLGVAKTRDAAGFVWASIEKCAEC